LERSFGDAGQLVLRKAYSVLPCEKRREHRRASRIAIASSALLASTTSKPASPIISAAFIRSKNSSSTMRTTGRLVAEVPMTYPMPMLSKCRGRNSFRGKGNATNRTRALGNVHGPARISQGVAAHHISNHRLAEGARRVVIGQRHAASGLTVAAIGVMNRKAINQHGVP
jgi:hypothetical protein